ncbi:hypothetical protein [Bifidobacterium mongoliense]|uniref:Uncharacterized protein n=1 Tax=Bifidobacterium mongoliense TaxID=518643 RepID=A0A423UCZ8_9BIFI|nr:hypothetical protein [Bifidobacterium mongoliense]ROT86575.1 hypothetical protein BMONG18_1286 [Bifidobacterium mongoliense]
MIQAKKKAPDAGTLEADINESSYRDDSSSRIHHYRVARLACKGDRWRPARLDDVITERGEFVGDGVARTAGGFRYEPLDWSYLGRCA